MRLLGCLTLLVAALWTGLNWLVWWVAGSGEAAVTTLSRWLGVSPASTQWIGELFALAGGVAQWLIALVWLAGMGVIGVMAWLGTMAATAELPPARGSGSATGASAGPVIEGEVKERSID